MIEQKVRKPHFTDDGDMPIMQLHDTEMVKPEGRFAMALVDRWGMVQGNTPTSEDSAGRAMQELMPVQEVVDRAFEMANLTFKTIREKGLMLDLPTIAIMEDMVKTIKNKEKEPA